MRIPQIHHRCSAGSSRRAASAWTLAELLITVLVISLVLLVVAALTIFALKSFYAMGNYSNLEAKSRMALDRMTKDLRQAYLLLGASNTPAAKGLVLVQTNSAGQAVFLAYTWDSTSRTLYCQKTGGAKEAYLTECDRWDFSVYQRAPLAGQTFVFNPATNGAAGVNPTTAKLINMSWKCSRTLLGTPRNTESVQTAQIVLRNKQ